MKNEELYLLSKEALLSSLSMLESLLKRRQHIIPWPVEEPEFLPDGLLSGIHVVFKPRVLSLPDVQQRVSRIPQVSKLCEFVATRDPFEQLVAKQASNPAAEQIFHRLFWPFLWHYLSETEGSLDFDQNVFQDTYEGIIAYFDLPTIKFVFTAPLFGFDIKPNENSIELAPNVSINRISLELKKQLWHDASISSSWNKEDIISLKYQAVFEEDVLKTDLFSYSAYPYDIENLQALLRLVKREPISIKCVLFSSSPWYLGAYTGLMPRYLLWSTANPLIGRYLLPGAFQGKIMAPSFSPEEVKSLRARWANLNTMKNTPRFTLALHRLGSSYDKLVSEDRFLDLWIGLELLFPDPLDAKKGATERKLGVIPSFLDLTGKERRQVVKTLKDSKEVRREIVHGLPYQHKSSDFVPKIEEILAYSLLKSLEDESLPEP